MLAFQRWVRGALQGLGGLARLEAPLLLAARWHVAWVFFAAGLTKLRDWETTLLLFENEYSVPLLSPTWAAWGGTLGELLLPPLLLLGLLDRLPALGLLVVNIVAVVSLQEVAAAALVQHQLWGALLLTIIVRGPGPWSVDALWWSKSPMLPTRS
ncbi:putative oxidoreductase [Inhella inkyongensis]|uniref:Putative oxidoreductase n=1 Tax=Inhella inkyongensis TaxID=392593 RepID=A0A840S9L0_9BURK|nr:DoxX family protein [Inhella inkyongensis]MBB5206323.1 putative oxidoreductase [Inhella inkyongensis]